MSKDWNALYKPAAIVLTKKLTDSAITDPWLNNDSKVLRLVAVGGKVELFHDALLWTLLLYSKIAIYSFNVD